MRKETKVILRVYCGQDIDVFSLLMLVVCYKLVKTQNVELVVLVSVLTN